MPPTPHPSTAGLTALSRLTALDAGATLRPGRAGPHAGMLPALVRALPCLRHLAVSVGDPGNQAVLQEAEHLACLSGLAQLSSLGLGPALAAALPTRSLLQLLAAGRLRRLDLGQAAAGGEGGEALPLRALAGLHALTTNWAHLDVRSPAC